MVFNIAKPSEIDKIIDDMVEFYKIFAQDDLLDSSEYRREFNWNT